MGNAGVRRRLGYRSPGSRRLGSPERLPVRSLALRDWPGVGQWHRGKRGRSRRPRDVLRLRRGVALAALPSRQRRLGETDAAKVLGGRGEGRREGGELIWWISEPGDHPHAILDVQRDNGAVVVDRVAKDRCRGLALGGEPSRRTPGVFRCLPGASTLSLRPVQAAGAAATHGSRRATRATRPTRPDAVRARR